MVSTLNAEPDGVALAAPQIGIAKRLFVVRYDRLVPGPIDHSLTPEIGVYINPAFTKVSRRRIEMDEGCLSVRGTYGKTMRHERATVRAQGVDGVRFERGGGGILAQVFQHEIDHLEGILFSDHAHVLTEVRRNPLESALSPEPSRTHED
jgi:peptide deformylase